MRRVFNQILFIFIIGTWLQAESVDTTTLRQSIEAMKELPKGPFSEILWFCEDGTTTPPRVGCERRGGGIQHAQWSKEALAVREAGYPIATFYADFETGDFHVYDSDPRSISPLLLERYLINSDDGWILRKARYYRGAFQFEDEIEGASLFLSYLLSKKDWRQNHFLLLRESARLLPRNNDFEIFDEIRATARRLASQDSTFIPLRNKLHAIPEQSDIIAIRQFAENKRSATKEQYLLLAEKLQSALQPVTILPTLLRLENSQPGTDLMITIQRARELSQQSSPLVQFEAYADILYVLRQEFEHQDDPGAATTLLDASLTLENALMSQQAIIKELLPQLTRKQHLKFITANVEALYGVGLLSQRAYKAARATVKELISSASISTEKYHEKVRYLALLPSWSARELRWNFSKHIEKLKALEPRVDLYIPDRLRASTLALYSDQSELLQKDANVLEGISYRFFSEQVYGGILPLNPGVARGILIRPGTYPIQEQSIPISSQIYLVPDTTAELPPVAGIITAEQGNSLSHVQLLARNLGIPNVLVGPSLLPRLEQRIGQPIVLVASPGGRVEIASDSQRWKQLLESSGSKSEVKIEPDLNKLDLTVRSFVSLKELRKNDSGRIVGPKAANLGELKATFPEAVTEGVAIPFGIFAEVLQRRLPEGLTLKEWMNREFSRLKAIQSDTEKYQQQLQAVLSRIREEILATHFSEKFRQSLLAMLNAELGLDGTYGAFVRSDTNVEDLPSFTGAGLNLTVPNVIGIDKILEAIRQVWASPFTERAFSWRQSKMIEPTEVYSSVLILKTVPVEKSGVMVTANLETGDRASFTVAVNEGIAGVVSDQSSESLRIDASNGNVQLLSEAALTEKRVANPSGGLHFVPTTRYEKILSEPELVKLYDFYLQVEEQFSFENEEGKAVPADIEFGFLGGKLKLFQIRPFLSSSKANIARFFQQMDSSDQAKKMAMVDLNRPITFLRIQ